MGNICMTQTEANDNTIKFEVNNKDHIQTINSSEELVQNRAAEIIKSSKYQRNFISEEELNDYEKKREETKKLFALKGKRITPEEFESVIPEWIRNHELRNLPIDFKGKLNEINPNTTFDFPPIQLNENLFYYGRWNASCSYHGEGLLFNTKTGTLLQGLFSNGNMIHGRIIKSDETVYEGEINKFNPEGQGIKYLKTKDSYEGKWVNGKLVGEVQVKFNDGTTFLGKFNEAKEFDGNGKITWADGSYYLGMFKNNYLEGEGILSTPLFRYQGNFSKSKFEGAGKSDWFGDKQTRFEGKYLNGLKKSGVFYFSKGQIFQGKFNNNLPEGYGQLTLTDGQGFAGEFINGKLIKDENTSKRYKNEYDELLQKISKEPSDYLPHIKYDFKGYSSLVQGFKQKKGGFLNGLVKV